jgi:integrase
LNPETNKPIGSIKTSFKTALRKAEIQDFKFHDLRHTFASQLVRNGVDLYLVQKLLGHSTPMMTQRYAHLRMDHLREAIEKIDIQLDNLLYNPNSVDSTLLAQLSSGQN